MKKVWLSLIIAMGFFGMLLHFEDKMLHLTFYTFGQNEINLSQQSKKPILITFWASWCESCEKEVEFLNELYDLYSDKIDFYAINVSTLDRMEDVKEFIEKKKLKLPVLFDRRGQVFKQLRGSVFPTSILFSSFKEKLFQKEGKLTVQEGKEWIEKVLHEEDNL